MKPKSTIGMALSAFFVLIWSDFPAVSVAQTVVGSGVTKEEKREVAPFTGVDVSSVFVTTITIGPKQSVTLSVDDNLLTHVLTEVNDGHLEVKYASGMSIRTKSPQKVSIVVPTLDFIAARGVAKISATVVEGKTLKIEAEGASTVEVKGLSCDSVDVTERGASKVTLVGKGKQLTIDASGAIKLFAFEATFESAKLELGGSSQGEVNVTGSIKGEVSGASKLTVRGKPATRSVKTSGVSRVTY